MRSNRGRRPSWEVRQCEAKTRGRRCSKLALIGDGYYCRLHLGIVGMQGWPYELGYDEGYEMCRRDIMRLDWDRRGRTWRGLVHRSLLWLATRVRYGVTRAPAPP